MAMRDNFVTPWVKANGFGGVDMARLAKSIDQIGADLRLQEPSRRRPDIFTSEYLPPAERIAMLQ